MKTTKISPYSIFGAYLSTREQADALLDGVKFCPKKVVVDFQDVTYVSRSFADQFTKTLSELRNLVMIEVVNTNGDVAKILDAVSSTQQIRISGIVQYSSHQFTDKSQVRQYLLSID